jgi:type VI secretion system secreted protein Hcp
MAIDAFLKFEGKDIPGESVVKGHEGELEIQSFSFSASNPGSRHSATGGGVGKGEPGDMVLTHFSDKSGPMLLLCCCSGEHIPKATLYVRKAGGEEAVTYMEIEMTDILISSYSTGGASGGETMDSFSLNFAKINFIYRPQSRTGEAEPDVTQGWDIAAGEKV